MDTREIIVRLAYSFFLTRLGLLDLDSPEAEAAWREFHDAIYALANGMEEEDVQNAIDEGANLAHGVVEYKAPEDVEGEFDIIVEDESDGCLTHSEFIRQIC